MPKSLDGGSEHSNPSEVCHFVKRIWTFGILCMALTIFFVGHNLVTQRQAALQQARSDVDDLAQSVAMDMSRIFFGLSQIFLGVHNVLEVAPEASRPFALPVRHVLDELKATNPFVSALLVLDASGEIVHWTGSGERPSVRDRDYFTVHRQKPVAGLFISAPFPSRKYPGQWIFAVSSAYRDSAGDLEQVIVALVDLEYFRTNYAELRLSPGQAIALVSSRGDIYMRRPDQGVSGRNFPQIAQRLQQVDGSAFLRVRSHIDQTMRGISFKWVGAYPLVVAASYDEQTVLAKWRKGSLVIAGFGAAVVVTFFLLTLMSVRAQRKQARTREMLQKLAITDPLTQLANRRHALDCATMEIKKAQRQGTPLSFVLMDLDHFKSINDSYGHEKGDLVLQRVATVLNRLCRQTDVVSRFGGEEFLLILPDTDLSGAASNAEKIRTALEHAGSDTVRMTASFGVAQWREVESAFKDTLRRADRALYEAKAAGRNRVRIDRPPH
jgi:diguanylate cyclase (GGDEF)-like protein